MSQACSTEGGRVGRPEGVRVHAFSQDDVVRRFIVGWMPIGVGGPPDLAPATYAPFTSVQLPELPSAVPCARG